MFEKILFSSTAVNCGFLRNVCSVCSRDEMMINAKKSASRFTDLNDESDVRRVRAFGGDDLLDDARSLHIVRQRPPLCDNKRTDISNLSNDAIIERRTVMCVLPCSESVFAV
jgi:hypothetical protein